MVDESASSKSGDAVFNPGPIIAASPNSAAPDADGGSGGSPGGTPRQRRPSVRRPAHKRHVSGFSLSGGDNNFDGDDVAGGIADILPLTSPRDMPEVETPGQLKRARSMGHDTLEGIVAAAQQSSSSSSPAAAAAASASMNADIDSISAQLASRRLSISSAPGESDVAAAIAASMQHSPAAGPHVAPPMFSMPPPHDDMIPPPPPPPPPPAFSDAMGPESFGDAGLAMRDHEGNENDAEGRDDGEDDEHDIDMSGPSDAFFTAPGASTETGPAEAAAGAAGRPVRQRNPSQAMREAAESQEALSHASSSSTTSESPSPLTQQHSVRAGSTKRRSSGSSKLPSRAGGANATPQARAAAAARAGAAAAATHPDRESAAAIHQRLLHASTEIEGWTLEQDISLRQATEKHGTHNWRLVSDALGAGKSDAACALRHERTHKPSMKKGTWTDAEDARLQRLVHELPRRSWSEVAALIPGRSAKQCRERWCYNLDPNIDKGVWQPDEDEVLVKAQQEMGNKWAQIAAMLPGRTENAVKTRFKSIMRAKKREWMPEEDDTILRLHQQLGSRWDAIAEQLSGRTKNAVKTRYRLLHKGVTTEVPEAGAPNQILRRPEMNSGMMGAPAGLHNYAQHLQHAYPHDAQVHYDALASPAPPDSRARGSSVSSATAKYFGGAAAMHSSSGAKRGTGRSRSGSAHASSAARVATAARRGLSATKTEPRLRQLAAASSSSSSGGMGFDADSAFLGAGAHGYSAGLFEDSGARGSALDQHVLQLQQQVHLQQQMLLQQQQQQGQPSRRPSFGGGVPSESMLGLLDASTRAFHGHQQQEQQQRQRRMSALGGLRAPADAEENFMNDDSAPLPDDELVDFLDMWDNAGSQHGISAATAAAAAAQAHAEHKGGWAVHSEAAQHGQ